MSSAVGVVDDKRNRVGAIEAGLAQFGRNARLEGCVGPWASVDLADRFINFLVADDRVEKNRVRGCGAEELAFGLMRESYHLEFQDGSRILLAEPVSMNGAGSRPYQLGIVLIRDRIGGGFDAVIHGATRGEPAAEVHGSASPACDG